VRIHSVNGIQNIHDTRISPFNSVNKVFHPIKPRIFMANEMLNIDAMAGQKAGFATLFSIFAA